MYCVVGFIDSSPKNNSSNSSIGVRIHFSPAAEREEEIRSFRWQAGSGLKVPQGPTTLLLLFLLFPTRGNAPMPDDGNDKSGVQDIIKYHGLTVCLLRADDENDGNEVHFENFSRGRGRRDFGSYISGKSFYKLSIIFIISIILAS